MEVQQLEAVQQALVLEAPDDADDLAGAQAKLGLVACRFGVGWVGFGILCVVCVYIYKCK